MTTNPDPMTSKRLEAIKARLQTALGMLVVLQPKDEGYWPDLADELVQHLPALAAAYEEALRLFRQLRLEPVDGGFKYDIPDQEWAEAAARIVREYEGEG